MELIKISRIEDEEKLSPSYELFLLSSVAKIAGKGTDLSAGFPGSSKEISFTFLNFLETCKISIVHHTKILNSLLMV